MPNIFDRIVIQTGQSTSETYDISGNIMCHGYQYSEHGGTIINLYLDSEKTVYAPKNEHLLYIDVDDNIMYRYNSISGKFEQVGNDDYCVQGEVNLDRTEILFSKPLITLETTRNYLVDFCQNNL